MVIKEAIHKNIVSKAQWYQHYEVFDDVQKVLAKLKVSETPCPKQYWMGMPSMGQAIANTWFRPVFFYSKEQTSSFLPAFAAPNRNPPIMIALIQEQAHFVTLKMKGVDFPVAKFPSVRSMGISKEHYDGWQERYQENIQLFQSIVSSNWKGKGKARVLEIE